jgi:hypothetical protein
MKDIISKNNVKFTQKEIFILEKNKKFFSSNKKYINIMLEIIDRKSIISIRLINWFVSNYSKKEDVYYKVKINGRNELFYVYDQYKNSLKSYSKEYFDPFCRSGKIIYTYNYPDGEKIIFETSIGQLNFFRWAIRNKVIRYVEMHKDEIEKDMKESSKLNEKLKLSCCSKSSKSESISSIEIDHDICSSEKITSLFISPPKSSDNENTKKKRHKLSKSIYDHGIRKSNVPIVLDFE